VLPLASGAGAVYLSHMRVIRDYQFGDGAKRHDAPLGILTFEPHPRSYFAPDAAPFRLMDAHARETRLAKLGIERLYQLLLVRIFVLEKDARVQPRIW